MPQLDFNIWFMNSLYILIFFFFTYVIMFRYMIYPLIRLFYMRYYFVHKTKTLIRHREVEIDFVVKKDIIALDYIQKLENFKNLTEKLVKFKNYQYNYYLVKSINKSLLTNKFIVHMLAKELFGIVKVRLLNEIFK